MVKKMVVTVVTVEMTKMPMIMMKSWNFSTNMIRMGITNCLSRSSRGCTSKSVTIVKERNGRRREMQGNCS